MTSARRPLGPASTNHRPRRWSSALLAVLALLALPAWAAEKQRIRVDDYVIDAELAPKQHHLTAQVRVKFTALEDTNTAVFELHNAMHVSRVTDAAGNVLSSERSLSRSVPRQHVNVIFET